MIQAYLTLALTFLTLISFALLMIADSFDQPDWFKSFINTKLGTAILFVAGILVLLTLIFSYSPDVYWDTH